MPPKGGRRVPDSATKVRIAQDKDKILQLAANGGTTRSIAQALGLSKTRVHELLTEGIREIPLENAEQARAVMLEKLRAGQSIAFKRARDGEVAALNSLSSLLGREAALLGLNAPAQQEIAVTSNVGTDFADTTARLLQLISEHSQPAQ